MRKIKLFFACLLMAVLSIGQMWADAPAAVGTTLFSENFGGYSNADVPSGSVSTVSGKRVVYGDGSVTYTSADGKGSKAGTTKVTTENDGNLAGGTSPELMVGKKGSGNGAEGGSFSVAGIPSGGAQAITVSFKQNNQNLSVSVAGTGYTGSIIGKPGAAGERTFDVTVDDGADATFTLTFQAAATSNVRVDDILVTVKTAGEGGGSDPVAVTGVTLNKSELELEVDESETLTATVAPNNATNKNVSWESSNTAVATVADGTVTAVAVGSATITVTTEDGSFTDECEVTVIAATPAVEYVKFTGDIEEGDYVIYYDGKAMKNTVASNRISYESVTPANNKVKDPSDAIIWHIAPAETEGYWTMYNEEVGKYAVCTGSNNQANLNASLTNNALVSFDEESSGSYNILSKARQDAGSNNYYLRENTTYGFAFYAKATGGALTLYKKAGAAPAVAKPVISGEESFFESTTVTITCETTGATIRYTLDGTDPTSTSTLYSTPFSITETKTVKAIAILGEDVSAIATKTFTKTPSLETMQEIFDAASTTGDYYITFSNSWVVTGVSTNGKNVYITDGTKGMILFNNSGNMGLVAGNTLSGTVQRNLKLYGGAAELVGFTTEGLTKGTAALPAVQELDAEGIAALSGVNTGSLIKISGVASESSDKYYVAGVQLYNSLFAYDDLTAGNNYNVTGVYCQFNSTKEILPRSAADIEELHVYTVKWSLGAGADENLGELEKMGDSDSYTKYFDKDILTIGTYTVKVFKDDATEPITTKELEVITVVGKYHIEFDYDASQNKLSASATYQGTTTSVDNTVDGKKAVKFIENGQLFIELNGHVYNVQGQIIK